MYFNNLWLVRAKPSKSNRIYEFLENNIIAIGWRELQDMSSKSKKEVYAELKTNNYQDPSSKGSFNNFVNNMGINDLCIILNPDNTDAYLAIIKSNYYFDPTKIDDGYSHQRKVEFINKRNPTIKNKFPKNIQESFKTENAVSSLNKKIEDTQDFEYFLQKIGIDFNKYLK